MKKCNFLSKKLTMLFARLLKNSVFPKHYTNFRQTKILMNEEKNDAYFSNYRFEIAKERSNDSTGTLS